MPFRTYLLSAVAALALLSPAQARECADSGCRVERLFETVQSGAGGTGASLASPKYGTWGFDLSGMNRDVKPGEDFFQFANGRWAERAQIPSDRTRFGNFDILTVLSEDRVHAILEEAKAGKLTDKDTVKIGAAYAAFMDEALAEKLGARPIAADLAEIRRVRTKDDFTALMGKANTTAFTSILPLYIDVDAKAPDKYTVMADTAGLGLPDRDYYLQASFAEKKAKYLAYVQQILTLIGWEQPAANAKAIVDFETRLAEATWSRAEQRDRDKTYNPMTQAELAAMTPGFDWKRYLAAAEVAGAPRIVVTTNTAFPKFAQIYRETPLPLLKAWQAFHVGDGAAPYLSKRFVDASFVFRSQELSGQPEQRPRWKRGVAFANRMVGESIGRVYVSRYFTPDAKAKMDALVGNLQVAMRSRIDRLEWMSPETKAKAQEKLSKFTVKIGYPTDWRDYGALQVRPDDLFGNLTRSTAFDWRRDVARLNGPVDRAEWHMTPQTVNAYYNFTNNEIVFPAAILQPPFFDPDADPAINYGGIGGVIGHEISHGFDDQGRKSDGEGMLRDWWTIEDNAKFTAQADRLGAQYGAFEPLPGVKVNGSLTMGENIGDMGGISLGLDAYRASLGGRPAPIIDGLTGEQRVFLGWAQVWRQKQRDEALRQQVTTDPHSPATYRVIGPVRNNDAWYSAFDVRPGDKLFVPPEQRVRIW